MSDETPAIHDMKGMSELANEIRILLHQEDGHALFLGETGDHFSDLGNDIGLDSLGGFVQDQKLGLGYEGSGYGKLLLLTAGQIATPATTHLVKNGEGVIDLIGNCLRFGMSGFQGDRKVLFHGKERKDLTTLRNVTNPPGCPFVGRR